MNPAQAASKMMTCRTVPSETKSRMWIVWWKMSLAKPSTKAVQPKKHALIHHVIHVKWGREEDVGSLLFNPFPSDAFSGLYSLYSQSYSHYMFYLILMNSTQISCNQNHWNNRTSTLPVIIVPNNAGIFTGNYLGSSVSLNGLCNLRIFQYVNG